MLTSTEIKNKQQEEENSVYLSRFVTIPHFALPSVVGHQRKAQRLRAEGFALSKELANYRRASTSHAEQLHT